MRPMSRCTLPKAIALAALSLASCVNVDPETNEVIPRGDQRYEFDKVKENAEELALGMSKFECLLLLGSPAEKSDRGDVWVYLPERPAVIIPGKALRLEFENGKLKEHEYRAIVLGARL
jgi:outer membrane protein assembly factor BamE (lipoprotein component of BamABCDE complex)